MIVVDSLPPTALLCVDTPGTGDPTWCAVTRCCPADVLAWVVRGDAAAVATMLEAAAAAGAGGAKSRSGPSEPRVCMYASETLHYKSQIRDKSEALTPKP
jgi:hypothetical protein